MPPWPGTHAIGTQQKYALLVAYRQQVRTEVRNHQGANLADHGYQSHGCQILVATVVARVLQCFPLVERWFAKQTP